MTALTVLAVMAGVVWLGWYMFWEGGPAERRELKRWEQDRKRSEAQWQFFRSLERSLTPEDKEWIEREWHRG